ncbi:disease resistance protein RPM1-like [Rosa rugosa]|uniref:disease resistance protein RPM1-like n=1 Tax=Rosa rugosa TaxID=74645 RepID=UPI002B41755D|nr:disease resistance protein RPM1-like [Rosa rugosa]
MNTWFRRQISQKLRKVTKTIKNIPERNQRYGVGGVEGTSSNHDSQKCVQNQAESSLFIEEDEVVGIEEEKSMLIQLLMNEEKNLKIISVVGMEGSGKTTLVAKSFTNEMISVALPRFYLRFPPPMTPPPGF